MRRKYFIFKWGCATGGKAFWRTGHGQYTSLICLYGLTPFGLLTLHRACRRQREEGERRKREGMVLNMGWVLLKWPSGIDLIFYRPKRLWIPTRQTPCLGPFISWKTSRYCTAKEVSTIIISTHHQNKTKNSVKGLSVAEQLFSEFTWISSVLSKRKSPAKMTHYKSQ